MIILTFEEYEKLMSLKKIVNDKNNLPGERRLAMYEFDRLFNKAKKR